MLDIQGLETSYGLSQVLFGVSFRIEAGQVATLLGRNGMGKTTTVRSIMGMTPCQGGKITLGGFPLAGLASYRIAQAGIGLVPEGRQIFPNLTVRENLVATARTGNWNLARIFELFPNLKNRENNYGNQLSGGEQQMLAIGRALMTNPRLLILDEATEGLAPLIRAEIYRSIERLKAAGLSILLIDKDVKALIRVADVHYMLEKGRVVWSGDSAALAAGEDVQHRYLGVCTMKRENIVGRANVEDTPALEAYYKELERHELGALWNVANEIEPWFPQPKSVPMHWKWRDVQPMVRKAAELVTAEKAARRVVMLVNPGRKEWSAAAGLLYTGVQIMNPGEFTSAHRHQASALRFVMEGKGAYTVVDGERMELGARDFVLTPNGTWHDHGVAMDGTQCVWQDGLDIPLMNSLDANFFEVHKQAVQTPAPLSRENWKKPYSPVFLYKWDESFRELKKNGTHEYRNPLTGGPVMPTMGARLELVKETKIIRHTGSVIYQVASGHGWSEIGDQRFEWEEKDIFCIPSWTPYRHGASKETVLFSFNDFPAMKALNLYRESHD